MSGRAAKFRRHLSKIRLDIRRMKEAGFYNQKVTPDLLTAIAGVISRSASSRSVFTVRSVCDSKEFDHIASDVFTKPSPSDRRVQSEYDKFIRDPLLVLVHAGVLAGEKIGGKWKFRIANKAILNDISLAEGAALDFLSEYIGKMLADSGLKKEMDAFFERQDQESLRAFEKALGVMALERRGIGKLALGRILPKIVNIPAFKQRKRGRGIGGSVSQGRITLYDIRYNRVNWRDAKKAKEIPRSAITQTGAPIRVQVGAVMREVKEFHSHVPEMGGWATDSKKIEAHHIFPRGAHPELAAVRENIILLTPDDHSSHAHPEGTGSISKSFQLLCLLQKLSEVEKCETDPRCNFYSMSDFIGMLAYLGVFDAKRKKTLRYRIEEPADTMPEKKQIVRRVVCELRRLLASHYVGD